MLKKATSGALLVWIFIYFLLMLASPWSHAEDLTQFVKTTDPGGFIFEGANVPFGRLMWGPAKTGLSLTELSGSEMNESYRHDIPIFPTSFSVGDAVKNGFSIKNKTGTPGYWQATLSEGTQVELTATLRSGIARIRFPGRSGSILFDLDQSDNHFEKIGDHAVEGFVTRHNRRVFFRAEFSVSIRDIGYWTREGSAYVTIDSSEPVYMKIAISSVRPENAKLNLDTEISDWNFARIRAQAQDEWNRRLSRIEIQSDSALEKTFFYTELFHTFFQPNVFSDVNGEYLGFDQTIKPGVPGFTQYTSFSGWDIYRTWVPLMALLAPHEVSQMMQSLINDAEQCGGALPRWVVDTIETGVMLSGSATPIIAGAYAFGARAFDLHAAFRAMDYTESQPGASCQSVEEHQYLSSYLNQGYIPWSNRDEGDWAGRESNTGTLELAVGDHALSKFAQELGEKDRSDFYAKLSENWRNILNLSSGWFQPRLSDGSWMAGFNPLTAWDDTGIERGFTEGNAYHYGWMVPQNLGGLFKSLGGDEKVTERLDAFFTELNAGVVTSVYDTAAGSPHSWIGNEPSFDVPFEYNWVHAPWKTQQVVHRMLREVFMKAMPGADDLGALSAWAVWGALGLYPEIPGEPGLAIASPMFSKIIIHTGQNGKIILNSGTSSGDYIQTLQVNGVPSQRAWLDLPTDFEGTTELKYRLSVTPASWGSRLGDEPPSF